MVNTIILFPVFLATTPIVGFQLDYLSSRHGIWIDSLSNIYFSDCNSIHRSIDPASTAQPSAQPVLHSTEQSKIGKHISFVYFEFVF
jgi:hypothetical protein